MLSLDDPRWNALSATYTSGRNVAEALRRLETGSLSKDELQEFWQELCHQYDSTESGYAAVPHLVRLALAQERHLALEYLSFAAHILACGPRPLGPPISPDLMVDAYHAAPEALRQLGTLLTAGPWKPASVRYLLASVAVFLRRRELYLLLEGADTGIECPNCQSEIHPLNQVIKLFGLDPSGGAA